MAPRIDKGTLIILDIGRNAAELEENKKASFFESARSCAVRFIEHKIISQAKNLLGIILLGSRKTENVLAAQSPGTCKYIEMLADLQPPNWQMIRDLPENPSKVSGNWFDALLVAAEHFKYGVTSNITNKQIIIISNFGAPSDLEENDIKQAIHGFQEEGIEISVLGPDIYDETNCNDDLELIKQFVEFTNGAAATLEHTLGFHLLFHRKRIVNAVPWNVDLSIGPNIKIPVSSYIRIKDDPVVKRWVKAVRDPVTQSVSTTDTIEKRKIFINTENENIIKINEDDKQEKIIKGYVYGGQVIPFSEFDKSKLYNPGQKSLILYGFTKSSNITNQNLNGDGLSYVFGRKGDQKAEYAIHCLVECLLKLDLVGIVRRVYNNGNAPKMFVLMPVVDSDNFVCLSMAAICFKNEIKYMSFPVTNTKKYECTNEQVNAFKDLIRAMELSRAIDDKNFEDTDAFPILKMCSPSAQYVLDCIAFRALNLDKPLPPPRDEIMRLLNVVPQIEERAKEPLEKLNKLFTLNKVEVKKRVKKTDQPMEMDDAMQSTSAMNDVTMEDIPKINVTIFKKPDIQRVGTINPIEDFENLKQKLKNNEIFPQLADAIESIFFCSIDNNYTKALDAMSYFRAECVKSEPSHYNNWLKKIKIIFTNRQKHNIIDIINENKLGYILANENSLSDIVTEISEESQLYENDTVPNMTEVSISSEVDDLFDNM